MKSFPQQCYLRLWMFWKRKADERLATKESYLKDWRVILMAKVDKKIHEYRMSGARWMLDFVK